MNSPLFSRRDFLKTTALAAAGLPLVGARAAEPERKLGFALCGLGGFSTHALAPAFRETKFCRLAGIITGSPDKAARWKAQYDIADHCIYNYDTMPKLADNPDIDVVYVVTPNALHAESTIKAAKAGKHVLCEKPMEVSVEKCQQMIDACHTAKRLLGIGYRLRFEPNNLECVRLAREKVFGELKLIEAGFGIALKDPSQWRFNRALAGGGPLLDVGVYALQAMRYLSGEEPVAVSAIQTVTDPAKFHDIEESISWQMKFPSGVIANGAASYRFNNLNHYTAYAERGSFGLDAAYGFRGLHGKRSDGKIIQLPDINQFATEMDDFAQCILENRPTRVPGEEGLRDVKIMTAIYEAARTGRTVKV